MSTSIIRENAYYFNKAERFNGFSLVPIVAYRISSRKGNNTKQQIVKDSKIKTINT